VAQHNSSRLPVFDGHLLLEEITHRVNNEFAAAIGTLSLVAARSANCEVRTALAGAVEHLHSHARVHRALQIRLGPERVDAARYVRELCESISLSRLRYKGIELVYVEHPLGLSAEQCWRLGMIIFELVTNASRHAFGEGSGVIKIELSKRGAYVHCRVVDNGSAAKDCPPGQGTKIIRALVKSLGGEMTRRFAARGTVAILSFPHAGEGAINLVSDALSVSGVRSNQAALGASRLPAEVGS
jgi:two-component sensor histidine kinase